MWSKPSSGGDQRPFVLWWITGSVASGRTSRQAFAGEVVLPSINQPERLDAGSI